MLGGTGTHYQVITDYRTTYGSPGALQRYTADTRKAQVATAGLQGETAVLGRSMGGMGRSMMLMSAGFVGVAAAGFAVHRTFANLSAEIDSSTQLAAQMNLAFSFDPDPVRNFTVALGESRSVFRELVKDAAELPGELTDFIGIARQISGGVFVGGGDPQQMRALTARIALAAPAAGAGFDEAGLGAMQMLFGVARVTNPLFKMLVGTNLIPKAETFNALAPAQRLEMLDTSLAKLTDNPMFRKRVLHTFDTQLGTLQDNLFGIEGILGQLGAGPFDNLLTGLEDLNVWLEKSTPGIVRSVRALWASPSMTGLDPAQQKQFLGIGTPGQASRPWIGREWDVFVQWKEKRSRDQLLDERTRNMLRMQLIGEGWSPGMAKQWTVEDGIWMVRDDMRMKYWALHKKAEEQLAFLQNPEDSDTKFTPKDVLSPELTQNITVKIDVKTDDSPEAIAVKMAKATEEYTRHPTMTGRAASMLPSGGTVR